MVVPFIEMGQIKGTDSQGPEVAVHQALELLPEVICGSVYWHGAGEGEGGDVGRTHGRRRGDLARGAHPTSISSIAASL